MKKKFDYILEHQWNDAKKDKRKTIVVWVATLGAIIGAILVVIFIVNLVFYFYLSSDYRERIIMTIKFADEILDGNITARETLDEYLFVSIFREIGDPIGRREHIFYQQVVNNNTFSLVAINEVYLDNLILIEDWIRSGYSSSFDERYSGARSRLAESTDNLLRIRNQLAQLAEIVGIEQR